MPEVNSHINIEIAAFAPSSPPTIDTLELLLLVLEDPDDTIEIRFCTMKFVLSDLTPCDLSIGVGTRQA